MDSPAILDLMEGRGIDGMRTAKGGDLKPSYPDMAKFHQLVSIWVGYLKSIGVKLKTS